MQSNAARCRVCGSESPFAFECRLLGRPVRYFDCTHCGYLQTESPDWLDEAYSRPINDVDTGIMMRNRVNVGKVVMTLAAFSRLNGKVVDHAGGFGILVRLLRDAGVDAFWRDKYCENLLARGFEADEQPADLVTAFEVIEHLVDPLSELQAMLAQAPAVLLTTDLVPDGGDPHLSDWWYLGLEHGQHIGFLRERTLALLATQLGCHYASDGVSVHLFSRSPVPVSWKRLQRAQRSWPVLARLWLRPRTMADFYLLRQRALSGGEKRR